eukprot:10422437-Alexandrium_andersonii.AAC.1
MARRLLVCATSESLASGRAPTFFRYSRGLARGRLPVSRTHAVGVSVSRAVSHAARWRRRWQGAPQ